MSNLNPYFDDIPKGSYKIKYNNLHSIEIVTDVSVEPIALDEVKRHCRVDFDDENVYLQGLISEAREQVEDEVNLALASKTIKVGIRNERGNFKLPYWTPEGEIIELTDKEDAVIDAASYDVFNGILETCYSDLVFMKYTTGYTTCPTKYKRMMLERVAYLYNNRGDAAKSTTGTWIL